MSRYLVDAIVTLEIECDGPNDFEAAVAEVLDPIDALTVHNWRVDDSFTVSEP